MIMLSEVRLRPAMGQIAVRSPKVSGRHAYNVMLTEFTSWLGNERTMGSEDEINRISPQQKSNIITFQF
jgi:hypothetical protein